MEDIKQVQLNEDIQELYRIIAKLSFPILASERQKSNLMKAEREKIDGRIDQAIQKYNIPINIESSREECWQDSLVKAKPEFESLPLKLRMNSFYMQEVLHRYVENQVDIIEQVIGG